MRELINRRECGASQTRWIGRPGRCRPAHTVSAYSGLALANCSQCGLSHLTLYSAFVGGSGYYFLRCPEPYRAECEYRHLTPGPKSVITTLHSIYPAPVPVFLHRRHHQALRLPGFLFTFVGLGYKPLVQLTDLQLGCKLCTEVPCHFRLLIGCLMGST